MGRIWKAVVVGIVMMGLVSPAMARKGGGGKGGNNSPPAQQATPTTPSTPDNSAQITSDTNDLATARSALTQATKDLDAATAKLVTEYEATPEFLAAKKAADDAAAALQTVKDGIVEKLMADPAYKSKADQAAAAQADLDKLHADGGDKDAIAAKSTEAFDLDNATKKMQRDAMEADPGYKEADAKSSAASTAVTALRNKFKDSLKTDARLADQRKAKDDAQAKVTAAQAKLVADRGF